MGNNSLCFWFTNRDRSSYLAKKKEKMKDILKTIIYVVVIILVIYFVIWLISGNGIDIIKAKTNKAITGESFDKNGENVRSWISDSESECKRDCIWDTKEENPIYIWEETNRTNQTSYLKCSPLDKECAGETYMIIEGRCYCKY